MTYYSETGSIARIQAVNARNQRPLDIEDKKRELALNRIQQAEESLAESFISAVKDYLHESGQI